MRSVGPDGSGLVEPDDLSKLIRVEAGAAHERAVHVRLRQQRREPLLDDLPAPHGSVDAERFADNGHWQTPPGHWELDTPEALLAEVELRECLDKTVASLSELQASVLVLRERQGLELEAICNLLDISLSNARVLLHRARLKVFATLEHFEETGQW